MAKILVFLLWMGFSFGLMTYMIFRKFKNTLHGKADDRSDRLGDRLTYFLTNVVGQDKVLQDPISGLSHVMIMWGFVVLGFGAINLAVEGLFGVPVPFIGDNWLFIGLKELFLLLVYIGVILAVLRRTVLKPARIENSAEAFAILGLISLIVTGDLLYNGAGFALGERADIRSAAFFANFIAGLLAGTSPAILHILADAAWWTHFLAMGLMAILIPGSKHLHLAFAPANAIWHTLRPKGSLTKVDFDDETEEEFGVNKLEQFTWKQLFDTYSCVRCGRCTEHCPAFQTGKPLDPRALHVELRAHMEEKAPLLDKIKAAGGEKPEFTEAEQTILNKTIVDGVFSEEFIWSCTTCRACEQACPVSNEHVQKIIDLRRYMVMTEAKMPEDVQRTFNCYASGNPWKLPSSSRGDWMKGLDVPAWSDKAEYLLYVGCSGAYDDRAKKVSAALVKVLQAAGVNFGVLGNDEPCCSETTRRLGNEFEFQQLAESNVELFKNLGVKKIITLCPHCFNSLKNDYPDFGGEFEVIHHSQFLARLIQSGKIKVEKAFDAKIVYHDACYLGRYNDVFEAPRAVLQSVPGVCLTEMGQNHKNSFCCGAGGGRNWMEEKIGDGQRRINEVRAKEALDTGAEVIATACPYCLTMMLDGTKAHNAEERVRTLDIAEILAQSIKQEI
ncbi:(Fe-S)-binding protein [Sporomusa acidovorans]|uniref:Iron-sulfur-binding oxidoreductase FadF n=1 Tax=Sporomusa acidovorans (strain ATCC 49682 / DSM 3132 / Mol) TaxID=1123286 RepID=A0ABZ3IZW7_SPOA4|nr:(Fe-S)-binding protein [Sporomusa acidovorans]OZC21381.1 anaerobic glycerol-3-phosphate dehydrogenase subunit C [Sporomusa acidovorans DSM 3132]SDE55760.1 Fe-S oxidoreductase [Sporomusa acidovorans]